MEKIYKYINYILVPLMLFIIFVACGGDEPEYNESMSSPRMMSSSESASLMPKEVSSSPGSHGSDQLTNISERKISKNAQLEIKVKSLDDSMNFITQKTNSYSGYIVNSSSNTPNSDYEIKTANISGRGNSTVPGSQRGSCFVRASLGVAGQPDEDVDPAHAGTLGRTR